MFNLFGSNISNSICPQNFTEFKQGYTVNTGNMMFHYALRNIAKLKPQNIPWSASLQKKNSCTGLIMPMANQVGAHFDFSTQGPSLQGVNVPVVALGLGAQFENEQVDIDKIPNGTVDWLKQLSKTTPEKNIAVRGEITKDIFDQLGLSDSVEVLGCPSHFINKDRHLGRNIKKKLLSFKSSDIKNSLSVVAGNPFLKELAPIEKKLINFVNIYNAEYVIQHPQVLIELSYGWEISSEQENLVKVRWFEELSNEDMLKWFKNKSKSYISVPQWFLDNSKKNFSLGTRIHGCQAAIQSGTPALCIYIDTRTKELCDEMRIPCISVAQAHNMNLDDMIQYVMDWDWESYDSNRMSLASKTASFLTANNIEINSINKLYD